jgi:hypothetical protein
VRATTVIGYFYPNPSECQGEAESPNPTLNPSAEFTEGTDADSRLHPLRTLRGLCGYACIGSRESACDATVIASRANSGPEPRPALGPAHGPLGVAADAGDGLWRAVQDNGIGRSGQSTIDNLESVHWP